MTGGASRAGDALANTSTGGAAQWCGVELAEVVTHQCPTLWRDAGGPSPAPLTHLRVHSEDEDEPGDALLPDVSAATRRRRHR